MSEDLSQYRELYLQTSKEYIQSLNAALLKLEKNATDATAIDDIFRSAHSLKSQSAAMDYQTTGYLCHVIEDVFYEVKKGRLTLTPEIADKLFAALDALGSSIAQIEKEQHEVDLSTMAEELKKLSGVATTGAGKSTRGDTSSGTPTGATPQSPAPPASPAPSPPPTTETAPAEAPPATKQQAPPPEAVPSPHTAVTTIPVKVSVLDDMMDLLENLLVERLKLKRLSHDLAEEHPDLQDYINASEKILASLQYQIMKARAVPVSLVFDHFPRAVRDLARIENKEIELIINGADLELDRTIVDHLDEPLIHLLRNAVSHGIKDKGRITLTAERQKDYAQISVNDDGQGVDWPQVASKAGLAPTESSPKQLKDALFSGISTSAAVTQISGRGVGLKAIKKMVDDFGGSIDVISETGTGTTFAIKLPLTLAIAKALLVTIGDTHFALPTLAVERIVSVPLGSVKKLADQDAIVLDEIDIPLLRLETQLAALREAGHGPSVSNGDKIPSATVNDPAAELLAVIIGDSDKIGLIVDSVLEATDIVIKPVPAALKGLRGFSGVTILSDGTAALIINPQELQ